jgi:hypothetical protein
MEESGDSAKNNRGDPIRGLNLLFPVSNCHTTIAPSKPPIKIEDVINGPVWKR